MKASALEMLRILFCLLCVSLCGFGFLLEGQKPANDHDLLRYVDNVVTNLVNMTTKLEKDIGKVGYIRTDS